MKRYLVALAALMTLGAGTVTAARAVEFDVGPGGVYVGPHRRLNKTTTRLRSRFNRDLSLR
jgi:hypothetical protein